MTAHPQPTLPLRHLTALELASSGLRSAGDDPAILYFDETLSGAEVDADSDALAAAYRSLGVRRGDRVALVLQNVPQFVIGLIAAWKAGAIAVPINPMLKTRELTRIFADCGARLVVCLDELYEPAVREATAATAVDAVVTTAPADWLHGECPALLARPGTLDCPGSLDLRELIDAHRGDRLPAARLGGDDIALLVYTSGTTGPPKGAMNLHRNVVFTSTVFREWVSLGASDRCLALAPLFHVTGLIGHIGVALAARMPLILGYRFDATQTLRLIERQRPTFTIGAITAFTALMNDPTFAATDLSSLRAVYTGGAPVPSAVVERWRSATGQYLHNAYGLTETTSPSHLVPLGTEAPIDPVSRSLSIGVPVYDTNVEIVDDAGRPLPCGEVGEIVTAGPGVVPGYWEKPEETAHALGGGRLRTGDVGFENEDGWFFLVDRRKDMIVASGYKVWPREVEDVLYEHPAVHEAAVVGVPDEYRGETVKAFVVLRPGVQASAENLIAFARERLAAYKYPRQVEVLDELPKTATGKVLRRELRSPSDDPGVS
jgi:long-chain acyl-CoA synthetase